MGVDDQIRRILESALSADLYLERDDENPEDHFPGIERAEQLGLVRIYQPGGAWGVGHAWALTDQGRAALGLSPPPSLFARLLWPLSKRT